MTTFRGFRQVYPVPPTCAKNVDVLLLCAYDKIDPCFECPFDRAMCHGRLYDSPDANGIYYRFDINGQWMPYTPIKPRQTTIPSEK